MNSRPNTPSFRFRRNLSLSLAAAVALTLVHQGAQAAQLTWDADGNTEGVLNGGGTWNTSNLNWWTGTQNVQWNSAIPDAAIFGDGVTGGGTVTLGESITVGDLIFNSTGYTIAGGGNTLTLLNTTIGGTASATISANLAGTTGLTITNNGTAASRTVTLSGTNTYSGTTLISGPSGGGGAQVVRLNSAKALGNSSEITVGSGSGLMLAANATFGLGQTITIAGGGVNFDGAMYINTNTSATWAGTIRLDADARIGTLAGSTLTLSGPIQNGASTTLQISARGTGADTGEVIISGTQNTYTGTTGIIRGILKLGANDALPIGSTLDVDSSTAAEDSIFDLNGFNQMVAALQRGNTNGGGSYIRNSGASRATLTVNQSVDKTYSGVIQDGTSLVDLVKSGSGRLILSGANTSTGTVTQEGTGTLEVSGLAGALAASNVQINSGTFLIDNSSAKGGNNTDRLASTTNVTLNGGRFYFRAHNGTDSSEAFGALNVEGRMSTFTFERGGSNTTTLTASQLSRSKGGGAAIINGAGLGTSAVRLMFATAPTLPGADTTATNKGIVPYLYGNVDANGNSTTSTTPNTFLTYDAAVGLRPLHLTNDYRVNSIVAGDNIRLTTATTASTTASVNSLLFAGGNLTISQTITNTSGGVLFASGNTVSGGTLDFGGVEGIITVNSGLTAVISSRITGTNGLSFFGPGTLGLGSILSTYTGETKLYSGVIVPQVDTLGGGSLAGPFGLSTLVFAGSQFRTTGTASSFPTTLGNAVRFEADTTFITGGGRDVEFSGQVTLTGGIRTLTISTTHDTILSGQISGAQAGDGLAVAGNNTGAVVLSGFGVYTGPTIVKSGTLNISGSITGTPLITVENAGTLKFSGLSPFFGGDGRIGDDIPLTLGDSGGTGGARLTIDNSDDSSSGVRLQETLGTLTLENDAIIDLGTGDIGTILEFAASQGNLWSGTLSIYNWTNLKGDDGDRVDQIFFGGNQFGLTAAQLAQIIFYSDAGETMVGHGALLDTGELVAIPEPSSVLSLFAMFGGLLGGRRLWRRVEG